MSEKRKKIAALIEPFHGQELDARYLGYFACFNQGRFFEAHEVLEDLWLADRKGHFIKGLFNWLAHLFIWKRNVQAQPAHYSGWRLGILKIIRRSTIGSI